MSRNRPRVSHNQDADEERRIWSQIKADAKKIDGMVAKSATIGNEIVEIEKQQAALVDSDQPSNAELDDRLESLYRENVRISEQVQHIIEGKSDDMSLLDSIQVLKGLRQASEESSQTQPPAAVPSGKLASAKQRGTALVKQRKAEQKPIPTPGPATEDGEDGSAAPSPRVSGGRLVAGPTSKERTSSARASSVPSTREPSVKLEDGAESVASSVDADSTLKSSTAGSTSATSAAAAAAAAAAALEARSRLTLNLGAMVFYRNKGRAAEGEGILCRVTNVIGESKQRRYEIQDADPDPAPGTEAPPAPYRASVSHLVPIPQANAGLPDLPKGKNVLAQYPDTTTFYKAEVSMAWRGRDLGNVKGEMVRLIFEGEEDDASSKEKEVERRFVLLDK